MRSPFNGSSPVVSVSRTISRILHCSGRPIYMLVSHGAPGGWLRGGRLLLHHARRPPAHPRYLDQLQFHILRGAKWLVTRTFTKCYNSFLPPTPNGEALKGACDFPFHSRPRPLGPTGRLVLEIPMKLWHQLCGATPWTPSSCFGAGETSYS